MLSRGRRRHLTMGLATILGLSPRGFFLPYRYADSVQPGGYPGLEPLFEAAVPRFETVLAQIEALADDIERLAGEPPAPRFDQAWFPRLDALAAYTLVRKQRPSRIVEVGSGHSTRFLAAAIRDAKLDTELVCIDPAPRASLAGLDVAWRKTVLQGAPPDDIDALGAGDLLFIDSSHLLMPGTDVDYLIGHVLPALAAGVLLHIHDIFLPAPYPEAWAWRGYNEQAAIAALLQGDGYDLMFASHAVTTRMAERLKRHPVFQVTAEESGLPSSLWLKKRGARQ